MRVGGRGQLHKMHFVEHSVQWRLALVIFISALLTKMLQSISGRVARWVSEKF